jgi:DNA-binding response OmpR family regulator
MEKNYTVFVVDDDKTTRLLLETMLGKKYTVEAFDSAESCLDRLEHKQPDLFLLDVGLPGMDGYDLCRNIKGVPEIMSIPVVFLSGHDDIEAIVTGYDAGGEDYFVKPFEISGLSRKIENLRRIEQDKKALLSQAKDSDELATLVLANLDEYAVLIKVLRSLNECNSTQETVDAILRSLDAFHLEGAVQIRLRNFEKTFSKAGENWPLEIAVMNHIRTLDRIFEFRTRCAYNFEHITVLVTNMPVADADLCGRIRDHLAIAAEAANEKLIALQSFADNTNMRGKIHGLLENIGQTMQSYNQQQDQARFKGTAYRAQIVDELLASFSHLGMSGEQEDEILEMIRDRSNKLTDLYDITSETRATFGVLSQKLADILTATEAPATPRASAESGR